jgi:hypothetical protein
MPLNACSGKVVWSVKLSDFKFRFSWHRPNPAPFW